MMSLLLLSWGVPGVAVLDSLSVAVTPVLQESVRIRGWPPFLRDTVWIYTALREEETLRVVVDDVRGKHEPITFAVGVRDDTVRFVEILAYREPYGGEIQDPRFLTHFEGKTRNDPFQPGKDIPRIVGATISVQSITLGVQRALWLLKHLASTSDSETRETPDGISSTP